jgi:protein-arginine kinase activator protein McsA
MKKASYSDDTDANEPQEDKNWIKNFMKEQDSKDSSTQNLTTVSTKDLNSMLAKLVKAESYEAAAKIRDELSRRK